MRLTDREAIRRALNLAVEWEISLIQAYDHSGAYHLDETGNVVRGPDEEGQCVIAECRKNIEAFKRVLTRYYGQKPRSLDLGKSVSVSELLEQNNETK
jgi:hypothetical protein